MLEAIARGVASLALARILREILVRWIVASSSARDLRLERSPSSFLFGKGQ